MSQSTNRDQQAAPGTRVPPMLLFGLAFLAALWWDERHAWRMTNAGWSWMAILIGTYLVSFGAIVFVTSLWTFVRAGTNILLQRPARRFVTHGPYAWSRNPMYVAFVSMYVGCSFLANTMWPLVLLPVVILVLERYVIRREERYLTTRFDNPYLAYTRRVRRWL